VKNRKQKGLYVRIGHRWFVRYWERRNEGGTIQRRRKSHHLGPVTTRGKRPPADIVREAERHMAEVNSGVFVAERIVSVADFVVAVYFPMIDEHKRPSTANGYHDLWKRHLQALLGKLWLKDVRTHHVQRCLNELAKRGLSRNTLKHIKSLVSGIFTLAKQQDYFHGENPAHDTAISPAAAEPEETYAYSLDEIHAILAHLPEPAATAFAVAADMGLRHGEIQGLRWEDYRDGQIYVSRSIWNGRITEPKTRKGRAPVPVIKQLAERLELHRLRCGSPKTGPMFPNAFGRPLALTSVVNRVILPALNRCVHCGKPEVSHPADHGYERDARIPEWKGWHAARRGLGSNLYRLGVHEKVIQAILRHANVSTTATYYIKTAAEDVRAGMATLENEISNSSKNLQELPPEIDPTRIVVQ
jgi:integrase